MLPSVALENAGETRTAYRTLMRGVGADALTYQKKKAAEAMHRGQPCTKMGIHGAMYTENSSND